MTTIGKMLVFNINSFVLKVSVTVFNGGVVDAEAADSAKTTAGRVSMDGAIKSGRSGKEEVRMFSGAGMVSVWKRGVEVLLGLKLLLLV